ncbi:hypothetical protein [Xanthomonas axonopodis]|uniref:hypothetical protein n=1 Tax=Xanthomonas axonopodis TaxID=53413 RepID=UPI001115D3F6|nr:hypothetical protein [Xanthomonas axonopodis]
MGLFAVWRFGGVWGLIAARTARLATVGAVQLSAKAGRDRRAVQDWLAPGAIRLQVRLRGADA